MGVADDGVGDVAHEGAFHPAEPAASYNDQARADVLGEVDDGLVPAFVHLQVGDRDVAAGLLDLPDLLVEYLLGLAPEILARLFGVDPCRWRRRETCGRPRRRAAASPCSSRGRSPSWPPGWPARSRRWPARCASERYPTRLPSTALAATAARTSQRARTKLYTGSSRGSTRTSLTATCSGCDSA